MVLELITLGCYALIRGALQELNRREEERILAAQNNLIPSDLTDGRGELYTRLPVSRGEMRLLRIKPGVGDVRCSLFKKGINEGHQYDALSYTWGESTKNRSIFVDDIRINVTDNLYDALWQFRGGPGGEDRVLWVDAVCIDQREDKPEKRHQVDNMHHIYLHAERVLVWLGKARPSCGIVATVFGAYEERKSLSDEELLQMYLDHDRLLWAHLVINYVCRLWWTRGWIIQEVMLAKKPILYSGCHALSFDLVLQLMKLLDTHIHDIIPLIPDQSVESFIDKPLLPIQAMRHYRKLRREGTNFGLHHWISEFAQQITSDPLDRVYAYIGLSRVGDETFPLTADYGKPVEVVWAEAYRYIIQRSGYLDGICQGRGPGRCEDVSLPHKRTQSRQGFELPSWVPDLTVRNATSESLKPPRRSGVFCAGTKYRRAHVRFEGDLKGFQDLKRICVAGVEVDVISAVTSINDVKIDLGDDYKQEVSDTQRFVNEVINLCLGYKIRMDMEANTYIESDTRGPIANGPFETLEKGVDYHGLGCTWLKALGKTLMMDLDLESQRLKPEEHFWNMPNAPPPSFRAGLGDPEENKRLWAEELHRVRHQWTIGRRFFITRRGYMGIGPPDAACLDMICVLDGASMPFVLRRLTADGGGTWEFLGDCYLHGFMDDEAFEEGKRNVVRRDFVIA